ncbi:MAG: SRPBCC domain-containing protein [Candidatus Zixiibacteriota bacterium]
MTKQKSCFVSGEDQSDRILRKEIIVPATLEEVWNAWTTTEGVKTFFSSDAKVELVVGGTFEIYFLLDAPHGARGSEGCRVLSYVPPRMLSFSWNAPPEFGKLRGKHTIVVVRLEEAGSGKAKVLLSQHGWGKGEDWDKLYDYFDKAWSSVLGNLKKRFVAGPIDW